MPAWKDVTWYRQGERGTKEPSVWEVTTEGIRLVVTKGHIARPDEWVMHCHALGIDTRSLELPASVEASVAQGMAKNIACNRCREIARALNKL